MNNSVDNNFPVVTLGEIGDAAVQTVNARELHAFMGVGKVFAAWLPDRIEQYGFTQNVDYVVFSETGNNPRGGRPTREYAISLDMAKELAMVERNEKGRQVRRYFIECERRAKEMPFRRSPRIDVNREHRLTMSQNVRWAKMAGLSGNQALLAANRATAIMDLSRYCSAPSARLSHLSFECDRAFPAQC